MSKSIVPSFDPRYAALPFQAGGIWHGMRFISKVEEIATLRRKRRELEEEADPAEPDDILPPHEEHPDIAELREEEMSELYFIYGDDAP